MSRRTREALTDGFFTLAVLWLIVGLAMLTGMEFSLLLVLVSGVAAMVVVLWWRREQRARRAGPEDRRTVRRVH